MTYETRETAVLHDNGMFVQHLIDCDTEKQARAIATALNHAARWLALCNRVHAGETFTFTPAKSGESWLSVESTKPPGEIWVSIENARRCYGRSGSTVTEAFDEACKA